MLNHITIMGRLTRDPEIRYTQSQIPVASFTVAVDRDFGGRDGGEKQTDFIDCVAWRQKAEYVQRNATKGRLVVVCGRLQISSYTDRDGNKRTAFEVVASNVHFAEPKRNTDGGSAYGAQNTYQKPAFSEPAPAYTAGTASDFEEIPGDDDLPF